MGAYVTAGSALPFAVTKDALSPLAAYFRFNKKLDPTPYTDLAGTRSLAMDSYLSTTAVTWIEVGLSLGLDEME